MKNLIGLILIALLIESNARLILPTSSNELNAED